MKRLMILFAIAAALALAATGCQLGLSMSDSEADADAIAAAVADPSDGMTQEAMDVGGLLFGPGGGSASMAGPQGSEFPSGCVRFFNGDLDGFIWDDPTKTYTRTREDFDVLLPDHTVHVDSVTVVVRFFTSDDASGEGYGPVDLSSGFDPAIHSMSYSRAIAATATRLSTGTVNAFEAQSDLAFTGIDPGAGTVTINGTRSRSFDREFTGGRTVVGTYDDTITDLQLTWDAGAGTLSWAGTLTFVFDATATRPNGTQGNRHREGTIVFSGSTTFTVVVDGVSYTYRLSDGTRVP